MQCIENPQIWRNESIIKQYLRAGNESNIFNLGNGVGFTVKEAFQRFIQTL